MAGKPKKKTACRTTLARRSGHGGRETLPPPYHRVYPCGTRSNAKSDISRWADGRCFSSPLWGRRLLSQYLSISTDLKLGLPKLPFWKRNKKVWAAADDRLHSRASTPQIARTMLEALRELAPAKSPGRAKPSARVSPPRWGGQALERHTVSFSLRFSF